MVDLVSTVESCYGGCCVGFSTVVFRRKKKGSVGMLTFNFLTGVVASEGRSEEVFQWKGGSPSSTAAVMVGLSVVGISTQKRRGLQYRFRRLPVSYVLSELYFTEFKKSIYSSSYGIKC